MTSGRPWARRLAAFAVILAVQFGIFEAALRTWGSSEAAPAFQGLFATDAEIGYRLQPGAHVRFTTVEFDTEIAINDTGVRDDEPIGPKAADERRIVVLGDSLVLAVQVPFAQTFCELLEARLNAAGGAVRYRVINAGVQGYGPIEEQLFFRSLARTLQPDVVLETVFVGNDAEEAVLTEGRLAGSAQPTSAALRRDAAAWARRLVRRSMVLQILRVRAVAFTDRFTSRAGPPEPPLQSYARHAAPRIDRGVALTRGAVEAIAADAAAVGARTGVVLMPARFQLDDADYGRLKETVREAGGELVRDGASERFDAALGTLPVPRIDLLPALRAALPGPDLFFQQTVHLTPRGHEVVARALFEFLDHSGLLDRPAPGR